MKASIHINTDIVEVIAYVKTGDKITIKDYITHPLHEECVINGVILDGAPVIDALRALKNENPLLFKDASLVIDGSFVYSKKISVPDKLNKKLYDEVIRDEFADVASDNTNLICTYYPLGKNPDGSKQILACAVENTHARAYLSIFNNLEIKLTSIHLGVQAVLHFIRSRSDLKNLPFVLNVVDGEMLLSMIFQDNASVFQSRTRLYGDDRLTLVRSTLDGLSGIIQFNKSQNFDDLTHCYYLGLSGSDMDLIELGNPYPELSFELLDIYKEAKDAAVLPPVAHFAYLNALIPDTQSDLLSSMRALIKARKNTRPKNKWIPVFISLGVLFAAIIALLWILRDGVEREVRELNEFLQNPATIEQSDELRILSSETIRLNNIRSTIAGQMDEKALQPQISRELADVLVETGGSEVTVRSFSFNSATGTISVSGASGDETGASGYVEELRNDPLIDSVIYTGYSTGSGGNFIFTIDVVAAAWREEANTGETRTE